MGSMEIQVNAFPCVCCCLFLTFYATSQKCVCVKVLFTKLYFDRGNIQGSIILENSSRLCFI